MSIAESERHRRSDDELVELISAFTAKPCFRSARTDELIVPGNFCRRPVRREDIRLIDFARPLTGTSALNLAGLIAHRILLCANEVDSRPEWVADDPDAAAYYDPETLELAHAVRGFLEWYTFAGLRADSHADAKPSRVPDLIEETRAAVAARQRGLAAAVRGAEAPEESLKFVLVQLLGLALSRRLALQVAQRAGGLASSQECPGLQSAALESTLARAAENIGLTISGHSHWQFYLSSALGCANQLYAACRADPARARGSVYFNELYFAMFREVFGDLLPQTPPARPATPVPDLATEPAGFMTGFRDASRSWEIFDRDLQLQIDWLARIDESRDIADRIARTIERERLEFDLDTFVETLDMCSTTHVHDEHRLVSIESGEMIFWANAESVVHLGPGQRLLVPINRLHGSSITTPECVYHQPIIPAQWLADRGIEPTSTE